MPSAEYHRNYRARKIKDPKWVEHHRQTYKAYVLRKKQEDPLWWKIRQAKKLASYHKHKVLKPKKARQTKEESATVKHNYYLKLKKTALNTYGVKCACCGETNLSVLSISHIDGNHPEGKKLTGIHLYHYLRHKEYPVGYRTLCLNCAFSLGQYGYCSHKGTPIPYLTHIQRYYRKLKMEVLKGYGEKCVTCGENKWEFLNIDHVANDGVSHRASLNQRFYNWLKDNNYPKGFQILCVKCNWLKHLDHLEKTKSYK